MSLLSELRSEGVMVELDGRAVVARIPPDKRTPETKAMIADNQGTLRGELLAERRATNWRVDALRRRLGDALPFPLPADLSILNLPEQPGRCPCCGESQPHNQARRCVRCCLAAATIQEEAGRALFGEKRRK